MHFFLSLLMPWLLVAGTAGAPGAQPPAYRPPGLAVAEHNGCLGCHSIDQKRIGPPFRAIAARYRGQPDAEEKLYAKVKHGGKGAWGESLTMPHQMAVKDEDIRTVVRWVLALP